MLPAKVSGFGSRFVCFKFADALCVLDDLAVPFIYLLLGLQPEITLAAISSALVGNSRLALT